MSDSLARRHSAGFTLLEILVAVFIMAMVLTIAFQAYQGIEQAYSRVGNSPSRDRAARIVLDRLERELVGSIMVQREQGADPLLHPYFFFGEMKVYSESEGDTLRFVTRTPLRAPAAEAAGPEIVTYGTVPSQTGTGLVLLRQAEPLPAQLKKDVAWDSPDVVVDDLASFLVRYEGDSRQASEKWDSTAVEQLDQLPTRLIVTVSLVETDPTSGQPIVGPEFSRVIDLPVRPFKLTPEGGQKADCGEGMTVQQCLQTFAQQISQASESLGAAIRDAQSQVQDQCWNPEQPSPQLQRLKVLMGGVPGFDASDCK
jgi:prepilin-type N-terminal cleavage/methylation domain-containing protein